MKDMKEEEARRGSNQDLASIGFQGAYHGGIIGRLLTDFRTLCHGMIHLHVRLWDLCFIIFTEITNGTLIHSRRLFFSLSLSFNWGLRFYLQCLP